ncbi:citramalate synthase [Streptomyces sp. SID8379]|uniref:citramalate synthase n=1 Tax=unclassified Streptomyces TaxID=2593676 RepID=UPI00035CF92A|nr:MULTISPECIES: citramalate synthase [unclassified Streptomyces]MYW65826.1 citramalate synthase [Streptomyces sp. SID8379]
MTASGFQLYDTTLRDGTQMEGLALTVEDKLAVARVLDALGVGFIEGGWPGAVPKDTEFFRRAATELDLQNAELAAFGATRRPGGTAASDPQVRALLEAGTPVVTIVAKSHPGHVEAALRTTLAENLAMIRSTVRHLVLAGRRVFLDAEHYFDAHRTHRDYALEVVRTAREAGAETVVLCDTNGGTLPDEVRAAVADTIAETGAPVGIHCHDDTGCAVANTLAAVDAGARHAQGTAHGYGERCGNANLFTVAADLAFKRGRPVLPPDGLAGLARAGRAVAEITGLPGAVSAPYIGAGAFTHKAGLHASALRVDPDLYQHIDPARVGNGMRVLVSEMGGRSSVVLKARELGYDVDASGAAVGTVVARVKELESRGYSFESADASFELLLRAELAAHPYRPPFVLESWEVTLDGRGDGAARATVRLRADGSLLTGTGHGPEPTHALDAALHAALDPRFPDVARRALRAYRVRELPGEADSPSGVCAHLDFEDADGTKTTTVGVAPHTTEATLQALLDASRHAATSTAPPRPAAPRRDDQDADLAV